MRTTYKILDNRNVFFVTSTIVNWIPVFNIKNNIDSLIESFIYSQKHKGLKIFSFVIMPEHFHMICESEEIIKVIQSIKSYSAKRIIEFYKQSNDTDTLKQFIISKKGYKLTSTYQVWQEGFHPKAILSKEMFSQKINYIHFNPVKRELVKDMTDYDYSSARNFFLNESGVIELDHIII